MDAKFIEIRENNMEISRAAEAACNVLCDDFIFAINHAQGIPTIAYAFIKEAIEFMAEQKKDGEDTRLNLFDLITLGINFTDSEDDEKLNNFEPTVMAGTELNKLIEVSSESNDSDDDE